jgi:hypothetical protein
VHMVHSASITFDCNIQDLQGQNWNVNGVTWSDQAYLVVILPIPSSGTARNIRINHSIHAK